MPLGCVEMNVKEMNSLALNRQEALSLLFDTVALLDEHKIIYHLEGGTLLGLVRDGDLLPWDHDLDISILGKDRVKAKQVLKELLHKKYRLTSRKFLKAAFAFNKGEDRVFKIKTFKSYVLRGLLSVFRKDKLKPITLDIFIKYNDSEATYWEASSKVMSVPNHHYESYDEIEFMGVKFKTPNNMEEYLTLKYGDWKVPVKEWKCGKDEGTIIGEI